MRASIVVLALVASPLLATVSRAQGGHERQQGQAQWRLSDRDKDKDKDKDRDKDRDRDDRSHDDDRDDHHGRQPQAAVVKGSVFNDGNFNRVMDAGEAGFSGWSVTLVGGSTSLTVQTDASGAFVFTNVPVGTYTVCATPQGGVVQTAPTSGPACTYSKGWTVTITTSTPNMQVLGVDFGFTIAAIG